MPGTNARFTLPDWIYNTSFEEAVKLLLFYFMGNTAPPAGSGGGGGITLQTVTRHSILLDSGGTAAQLIPTGAKGYGFTVITGTASDGTASGLPVGFSQSDPNTLAAGFTVTASGGTTFVFWNS